MRPDFSRSLALYGGSFDPVHEGHLHVVKEVKKAFPALSVVFVPACRSPGKPAPQASGEQRLRWLELAAGREFPVWPVELERGGESFTVDTLREAHRQGAEKSRLHLVMGADAYASLGSWKEPETIRSLCRIVAVGREGNKLDRQSEEDLLLCIPLHPASSTAIRQGLAANPPHMEYLPAEVKSELENLILLSKNPYARNLN